MKSKNIILVVIVVILITLSIFTITILKNKFSNAKNDTFKNTTMRDREYSNIVYDINGNPIDNL